MPEISVIVPLYNARKYLQEAIDSVLAQTFQDFEIIVVDDCSTDGSWELVNRLYGENDNVCLYRHENNKTAGGARNTGLEHAKGKYIAFLDSDDLYMPETLEIMHKVAEKYGAEVVHSPGCLVPQGDQEQVRTTDEFRTILFDDMPASQEPVLVSEEKAYRVELWARRKLYGTIWNKLFRRDFLDEHHIRFEENLVPGQDAIFLFRCVFYARIYLWIPDIFYIYRRPVTSVTRKKRDAKFIAMQAKNIAAKIKALDTYMGDIPWFSDKPEVQDKVREFAIIDTAPSFIQQGYHSQGLLEGSEEEIRQAFKDIYGEQGYFAYWYFHHYHMLKAGAGGTNEGQSYIFPYHLFQEGERTVIYGAGESGQSFYQQLQRQNYLKPVGIVDKRAKELKTPDFPVQPVEDLKKMDFDAILIAVINEKAAKEIKAALIAMGIGAEKIRWQGDAYAKDDYYNNYYFPLLRESNQSKQK
ncbi:glycosyltransferase family 2 protein [Selenomonas sp. KH1T6]|uniref:glycosyltransferase family 2 protein n=1 Tax=Selenomonas sp. KH1T6 TaxID=3158784 RepID=UPI0008A7DCCA|nr:Glycosyltransferase involved in cell wall bisynthesis [Selenomonas ruminantium]